jgi:FkbM family methyltransferase
MPQDTYIGKSLEEYGEYSEEEFQIMAQVCGPGDRIVEVGSHVGALAVPLAQRVGETGQIICFEPQPSLFQLLCANMSLNGISHSRCFSVGVGEKEGSAFIPPINYKSPGNFGSLNLESFQQGEQVPVVALDKFLTLPSLRLLKIDTEGMEEKVLQGAQGLIAHHRPYLYVENDRFDRSESLIRKIMSLGYRVYWHFPSLFNPENFARNQTNHFPHHVSSNMFCIPQERSDQVSGLQESLDPTFHPVERHLKERQ